jgi:hypothetical protein
VEAVLRRWEVAGLVALAVIVLTIPLSLLRRPPVAGATSDETPTFVGTEACKDCHRTAYDSWLGSDHDLAMAEASEDTVLGDFDGVEFEHLGITSRFSRRDRKFFIWTEGPGGEMAEFEVAYTFGHDPLQQYLIPFPGGRLQASHLAWDVVRRRWFHLYPDQAIPPDDWLHWTRNAQTWNGMCAECHSTNLKKGYDRATWHGPTSHRWLGPIWLMPAWWSRRATSSRRRWWSFVRPATRVGQSSATMTTPVSACSTTWCHRCW